eukprot:6854232-Prymnesium_polylepis.1
MAKRNVTTLDGAQARATPAVSARGQPPRGGRLAASAPLHCAAPLAAAAARRRPAKAGFAPPRGRRSDAARASARAPPPSDGAAAIRAARAAVPSRDWQSRP